MFALAAFALSILGYVFLRAAVISRAIESSQALKDAAVIDGQKQRAQEVETSYEKSVEDRAKLASYIVTEEKIIGLIEEIEKIGIDTGTSLDLSGITTDTGKAQNGVFLGNVSFHVEVRGPWKSILGALILLENIQHAANLSNVRIEETGETVSAAELPVKAGTTKATTQEKQWRLALDIKTLTIHQK